MKYIRFAIERFEKYGVLEKDIIREIDGNFLFDYKLTNNYYELADVIIMPPITPSKIVAIGVNYSDHGKEMNIIPPKNPIIFLKPSSAVIGHNDIIVHPKISNHVDYEGELAIVIGDKAKNISKEVANNYIVGVTICNDVTARDLQSEDSQWTRAKGFDTFAPMGPWIVNDLDYDNLHIETRLNGKTVQQSNTNRMIHNTSEIVAYVSSIMTLYPGDVIITGTPSGIGKMNKGDVVEVEIEGIGVLRNYNK